MFFEPSGGMRPAPLEHNPFNAIVCPRPIGWISTVDGAGTPNLAPFSYFNGVCSDPPYVMFAPNPKGDGEVKDTCFNLNAVPEFVASIVNVTQAEIMNATSRAFDRGVNEFEACGVEAAPSKCVRPPRVAGSRAALECLVHDVVPLPGSGEARAGYVVIGRVVGIHIDDAVIANGRVDEAALQPLARMGYFNYTTLGEILEIRRPA